MNPNRTLPKSLHTVSVIVAIARNAMDTEGYGTERETGMYVHQYVNEACRILGLDTMDDAYNLKAQAIAKLRKMGV